MCEWSRARHIAFVSIVPMLLVVPGAVLAVFEYVDKPQWPLLALGAGVAVVLAVVRPWRSELRSRENGDWVAEELRPDDLPRTSRPERLKVIAGVVPFLLVGLVAWIADGNWEFLALALAWVLCLPAVLLYLWLRGSVADRRFPKLSPQPQLSAATIVLSIPALIVLWSAWHLEKATFCATRANGKTSFYIHGALVGEASDRLYVGDTNGTTGIVSIPQSRIVRTVIGGDEIRGCP